MEIRLRNSTGGHFTVDIELTDTPLQVIAKAIKQVGSDAAIIMREPGQFSALEQGGTERIHVTESLFAVDSKAGSRPLEFNMPIQEQLNQELYETRDSGRILEFIVALAVYVGGVEPCGKVDKEFSIVLKNITGTGVEVNIEISDTPLQIIFKAIEQCDENAAILMCEPVLFSTLKECGTVIIAENKSIFAIDNKKGIRLLKFNLPIQEQLVEELTKAKEQKGALEFTVAVGLMPKKINAVIKNWSGGCIAVDDVDILDSPIHIIEKAIKNCGKDAEVICRFEEEEKGFIVRFTPMDSIFALDMATGNMALEWDIPIVMQAKDFIAESQRTERKIEFLVILRDSSFRIFIPKNGAN